MKLLHQVSLYLLKVIHAALQDCGLCCLNKYRVPKLLQFLYCIVDIDYLNNLNSVSVGELAINTILATFQFILVSVVTGR